MKLTRGSSASNKTGISGSLLFSPHSFVHVLRGADDVEVEVEDSFFHVMLDISPTEEGNHPTETVIDKNEVLKENISNKAIALLLYVIFAKG